MYKEEIPPSRQWFGRIADRGFLSQRSEHVNSFHLYVYIQILSCKTWKTLTGDRWWNDFLLLPEPCGKSGIAVLLRKSIALKTWAAEKHRSDLKELISDIQVVMFVSKYNSHIQNKQKINSFQCWRTASKLFLKDTEYNLKWCYQVKQLGSLSLSYVRI